MIMIKTINKTKVKNREGPQDGISRTGKLSSPCNKALFKQIGPHEISLNFNAEWF